MERCPASTIGVSRRCDTGTRLLLRNEGLTLASEITQYAAELRGLLTKVGADLTALNNLTAAAAKLGGLADGLSGPVTSAAWDAARAQWITARNAFGEQLSE